MKAIKRTVAAILATLMLATSTSFTLAAEEYSDAEAVVVAKVNGAGIMTGTDKGCEPSKSLTRAEAAAIIVRMKGIAESAVKATAGTTLFNDVAASHWASGYVNQASNLGIVKGVSATEFAPDREVTVAEFVTMAIRALGAGQLVDAEGTWPTNYVNFANEEGILDDVNAVYSAVATRMNAATIVANTMEANMWAKTKATTNNEVTWEKQNDKTILKDVLNIDTYKDGYVYGIDIKDRTLSWDSISTVEVKDPSDPSQTIEIPEFTLDTEDAADCVELSTLKTAIAYDVWYNTKTKEVVAIFRTEDSKTKTVEFSEIKKFADDKITVLVDGKEVKYTLAVDATEETNSSYVPVFVNGDETGIKYSAFKGAAVKEDNFGTLIVYNNKVSAIYSTVYTYVESIKEITDSKIKFEGFDAKSSTLSDDHDDIKYTDEDVKLFIEKDGKEIKVSDLEEEDVVFLYDDAETSDVYHMVVATNTVEGTISSVGTTYVTINKQKYIVVDGLKAALATVSAKDEVILYLNAAGKVVAINDVETTSKYAVVKSLQVVNSKSGLDLEVVLGYFDGTVSDALTLDLDVKSGKFGYALSNAVDTQFASSDPVPTASTENATIKTAGAYEGITVGEVYDYEIKGDKVALSAIAGADVTNANAFVSGKTKAYFTDGTNNVYVSDSTKILVIKKYVDDTDKDEVRFVIVELDDLDTSDATDTLVVKAYDVDEDTNKAKFIVIDEIAGDKASVSNKSDDWMMVLEVASVDEDDYNEEITLVNAKGEETVLYGDTTGVALGNIGIATISGDELTEVLDDEDYSRVYDCTDIDSSATALYVYKNEDGIMYFVTDNEKTASYVLSDDVLYVGAKFAGNNYESLSVQALKNIDFASYDSEADAGDQVDADGAEKIDAIYFEEVETGIYEIVAIIYAK